MFLIDTWINNDFYIYYNRMLLLLQKVVDLVTSLGNRDQLKKVEDDE